MSSPEKGLLIRVGRGEYELSEKGKTLLSELSLESPAGRDKLQTDPRAADLGSVAVDYTDARLPEEVDLSAPYLEGAVRQVTINAYERDREARAACIAYYGPTRAVCGFDFGAVYGPIAAGFIHVHHLKPLSEIGVQYKVDPVADLRPICPNCHAVIHLGGSCRRIEEVKQAMTGRT